MSRLAAALAAVLLASSAARAAQDEKKPEEVDAKTRAAIERAIEKGVHSFMTVQTLWGYCGMYVYDTGRDLMSFGLVPASNMLPEVAYMKLCWVLGQASSREEVQRLMLTPVSDEITDREPYNGYLIYQGAIPEVQEFIRGIKR